MEQYSVNTLVLMCVVSVLVKPILYIWVHGERVLQHLLQCDFYIASITWKLN